MGARTLKTNLTFSIEISQRRKTTRGSRMPRRSILVNPMGRENGEEGCKVDTTDGEEFEGFEVRNRKVEN